MPRVAPGTLARGENADGSGRAVEGQLLIGTIHHRKRNPFNFRTKKKSRVDSLPSDSWSERTQDFLGVSHGFSPTRVTIDFERDFWDIEAACSSHCIIATITSIGMLHRDGLILKTAIQKFGFESPR
ncbi:MAG TPA: hypothetical protein VNK23_16220 [Candidatus Dormibacteraeota bacterium]|nr:hypothetical protein [Candidatus Dormibacteraeota bacterium]